MGKTARLLLKNKWLKAVLITVTTMLLLSASFLLQTLVLPSGWALFFSVLMSLLIIKPTTLGYKRWCVVLKPDEKAKFFDLFYFFKTPKRYFKSVFVGLAVSLRVLLKAILSMFPPTLFFGMADWLKSQSQTEITEIFVKNCIFLGLSSTVIFAALFLIAASKTFAVSYFVAADETTKIRDAVKLSSQFMKENSTHLLKTLSPLLLLCVFVFPIFLIVPYFVTVFAQYIKNFKQEITFACV